MMEPHGEDHAAKPLQSQIHIFNHMFSFINTITLKCAIGLGIPDIIHNYGQPMPLSHLISALPIHQSKSSYIDRLMRILIHSGFTQQQITENEPEVGFALTDSSLLLLKDHTLSLRPFLQAMIDPTFIKPCYQLSTWFQNDDLTAFDTAHGMTLWDYSGHEPKVNQGFNDAMASDARLVANVVIDKCKGVFEGLESLVDVGGGTGTVAKVIAKAFPQLDCTVFDHPHVVAGLQGSENIKYVGGDMFEAIPPTDACFLKKCKEAIRSKRKDGRVIIIDIMMESEKGEDDKVETELFLDMAMMMIFTGKERNEKEWAKLIFSSGFNNFKITRVIGLRSLIEVYPQ